MTSHYLDSPTIRRIADVYAIGRPSDVPVLMTRREFKSMIFTGLYMLNEDGAPEVIDATVIETIAPTKGGGLWPLIAFTSLAFAGLFGGCLYGISRHFV
jgi:hypothetical protein